MKTNQLMQVRLGKFGVVDIYHKTAMGKLNDVLEIGNTIREAKGLKAKSLDKYLRTKTTWELILKVYNESLKEDSGFKTFSTNAEKLLGQMPKNSDKSFCPKGEKVLYQETLDNLPVYKDGKINYSQIAKTKVFESVFKVQNRGKLVNRGIWANLFIMLDLAQWLDVDLRYEIYKTFIEGKILIHRDNGGEEFKKLNALINQLPDRIKRANEKGLSPNETNKYLFIEIARMVNTKVKGEFKRAWNDEDDELELQQKREKLLNFLTNAIEVGFINSYDQLKATITRYKF